MAVVLSDPWVCTHTSWNLTPECIVVAGFPPTAELHLVIGHQLIRLSSQKTNSWWNLFHFLSTSFVGIKVCSPHCRTGLSEYVLSSLLPDSWIILRQSSELTHGSTVGAWMQTGRRAAIFSQNWEMCVSGFTIPFLCFPCLLLKLSRTSVLLFLLSELGSCVHGQCCCCLPWTPRCPLNWLLNSLQNFSLEADISNKTSPVMFRWKMSPYLHRLVYLNSLQWVELFAMIMKLWVGVLLEVQEI